MENIFDKNKEREFLSSNTKITHPIIMKNNEYILDKIFDFSRNFNRNIFSIIIRMKKYIPQIIKLKLAPCQNPVNTQTINKLKYLCLTLFPPRGM